MCSAAHFGVRAMTRLIAGDSYARSVDRIETRALAYKRYF